MTELWNRLLTEVEGLRVADRSGIETVCVVKRSESDALFVPQMVACEAMLRLPEPPPEWDPKALAVLIASVARCHEYLGHITSVPVFFEATLESLRMRAAWEYGPTGFKYSPNDDTAIASWLRTTIKSLKGNVLAKCKDIATARWPTATLGQKWTIAHILNTEHEWAKEVVEQALAAPDLKIPIPSLCEVVHDVEQAERIIERGVGAVDFDAIKRNLRTDAIPLLIKAVDALVPRKAGRVAQLLIMFDEPRAAEAVVHCLGKKPLRAMAAAYFEKGTDTGRAALKAVINGESARKEVSRVASIASDLLARIERGAGLPAVLEAGAEEATLDEVPPVIAHPPWKIFPVEARPGPPPIDLGDRLLEIPSVEEKVAVDPIAVMRAAALLSPEELAGTNEQLLEKWSVGQWYASKVCHAWVLDRLGLAGIANFDRMISYVPELCLAIDSPRIADMVAARIATFDYSQRSQQPCVFALRWIHRYPVAATLGLVPRLASSPHALRTLAILAARHDIAEIIRPHFGEKIAASVVELSKREVVPIPKDVRVATEVALETLTRPRLLNGKLLPLQAFQSLLDMIAFSDTRFPYSGIAEVRAACDPRSLAELAWDLACAWEVRQHGGGRRGWRARQENAKLDWLLYALVHFADEEVVRRLTPRFNGPAIVDVLGLIGTDAAVLELLTIFAREKDKQHADLRNRVHQQLMLVAARRGMPPDELEEGVLPDPIRVGASVIDGRPVIDYGPRHFEVRWTEDLAAGLVVDDAKRTAPVSRKRGGKPHLSKRLPALRKTDEPAKVARAKEVWATIVEDVAAVIARRVDLLGRAMEQGRYWTITELRRRYIDPPLLAHLTRGLLFLRDGDPPAKAFRVAEDASFADIDDAVVVQLDANDRVRLIKANDLAPEDVTRWRATFFDYGLIMPIAQLPAET